MAKYQFIKSARKDIYACGKRVDYVSERGKRKGQTLTKIDRTQPRDENDTIIIHKGESYYTWSFRFGGKHYSKTKPRPSQLTESEFYQSYYAIQEKIDDYVIPVTIDGIAGFVEELRDDVDSLRDETQEKFDNLPDSLQNSATGDLLQERIDEMDSILNELDAIDTDYDEECGEEPEEWLENKVQEIQDISFNL